jgi:hypothetical protein
VPATTTNARSTALIGLLDNVTFRRLKPMRSTVRFRITSGLPFIREWRGLSLSSRVAGIDPTKAELDYFRIAGKSYVQVTQIPEIDRANTATL